MISFKFRNKSYIMFFIISALTLLLGFYLIVWAVSKYHEEIEKRIKKINAIDIPTQARALNEQLHLDHEDLQKAMVIVQNKIATVTKASDQRKSENAVLKKENDILKATFIEFTGNNGIKYFINCFHKKILKTIDKDNNIKWLKGGSLHDYLILGANIKDLTTLGFKAQDLRTQFTAKELKDVGVTAKVLVELGYTLQELKDALFNVSELMDAGFTGLELRNIGFTVKDFKTSYSFLDIILFGFTKTEIVNEGLNIFDGWKTYDSNLNNLQVFKNAGFNVKEIKSYFKGSSLKDFKDAGFTLQELKDADFNIKELINVGFKIKELRDAGIRPIDINVLSWPKKRINGYGFY